MSVTAATGAVHDICNTNPGSEAEVNRERDASFAIADHLARTRFEDLPAGEIAAAKASILDTLGCIYAGTGCDDVAAVRRLTSKWGGRPSSTVIGTGDKVPAACAVFANGSAVHQFDFDDTHDKGVLHPTSASLLPALAVAEDIGGTRTVSGKDILAAVVLSNDLSSRMALATRGRMWDYPWFRAPVMGLFGATAASAKIMGASATQHLHALGLTLPQVAGTWASLHHKGSSVRALRDGLAYRNGVLAAEMAMEGLRGDAEVLEGPYGFYHAFYRGEYDRGALLDGLGEHYQASRISLKPWPSIRHLHTALTGVTSIMQRERLSFVDISGVTLFLGQMNIDRCRPVASVSPSGGPVNHIDLAGNMHFAVATVIRHGSIPLAVYHDPALANEIVRAAMPKVRWIYDGAFDGPTLEGSRVVVTTFAGASYTDEHRLALGHPDHPMTRDQRIAKFMDCAGAAATPLTRERALRIVDAVDGLDTLADIGTLMALLQ